MTKRCPHRHRCDHSRYGGKLNAVGQCRDCGSRITSRRRAGNHPPARQGRYIANRDWNGGYVP